MMERSWMAPADGVVRENLCEEVTFVPRPPATGREPAI